MNDFSKRLDGLVGGKRRLSAFARECGLPISTVRQYLEGSIPGLDKVIQIARAKNVSVQWLATGEGPREEGLIGYQIQASGSMSKSMAPLRRPDEAELPDGYVAVPQLDIRASAGPGRASVPAERISASTFLFQTQWLRSLGIAPQNAEFVQSQGDSMEPTIMDGDMMLLDRGYGRVVSGKIYVLVINDLVLVKRLHLLATGAVMVISDNERYPPETISQSDIDSLNIEARVTWFGRVI